MANYLADILFTHGASKSAVGTALTRNKMWGFDEATESIGVKDTGGTMRWFHSLGSPSGAHPNSILSEIKGVNVQTFFDLYRNCNPSVDDPTFLGLRNRDTTAHSITDWLPANVFSGWGLWEEASGGARLIGISNDHDNPPFNLFGFVESPTGFIDNGCIRLGFGKSDGGTGIAALDDSYIGLYITNWAGSGDLTMYGNGDIVQNSAAHFNGDWVDYGVSSVVTGWAGGYSASIRYKKIDASTYLVYFYITGTSNAVTASFTLPFTPAAAWNTLYRPMQYTDNGNPGATYGSCVITGGTATINCYTDMSGAGWTAANTKTIEGQFFVEV